VIVYSTTIANLVYTAVGGQSGRGIGIGGDEVKGGEVAVQRSERTPNVASGDAQTLDRMTKPDAVYVRGH
jgi:hypothetical protein